MKPKKKPKNYSKRVIKKISETWFISDLHFGHKKILEFEPEARPFTHLEEMHQAIITRWNSVVKKHDKVYVLGDWAFGRENIQYAKFLAGQKRLVLGNHDKYPITDYLQYFLSVHGVVFWEKCALTHVPIHPCQLESRARLNIHGHLHSNIVKHWVERLECKEFEPDLRYVNVSCEQNNLTPINADIILKLL